jgi:glutamate/tyrosine decarboxylase-like PLP-dependent enzyme
MSAEFLLPDRQERSVLWSELIRQAEAYFETVQSLPVAPVLDQAGLRSLLDTFPLDSPSSRIDILHRFTEELKKNQVHTPHPCYFGLFNPAPSFMGILADCVAATLNTQLAAWSHSPLAVDTESHLISAFADKFRLPGKQADGCLTSGGAEANFTALLCAVANRWPEVLDGGLRHLAAQPVFYASAESHHSFLKASCAAGLGRSALRIVPVKADLQMDTDALQAMVEHDRAAGFDPFLVIGTAGTTGAGTVDPLITIGEIARAHNLWFHADAAWGGAAALCPGLRETLAGIETADSLTFDPHKGLSIPMGAGMFLTRHSHILSKIFSVSTAYMPKEGRGLTVVDPYVHSLQWSRRFIGLKLFLTLATAGWDGYAQVLQHQADMGDLLRNRLAASNWKIVNQTRLPVVCFTPADRTWNMRQHQQAADAVVASGKSWISTILLDGKTPALRACITNYRTEPEHLEMLIEVLSAVRETVPQSMQDEVAKS